MFGRILGFIKRPLGWLRTIARVLKIVKSIRKGEDMPITGDEILEVFGNAMIRTAKAWRNDGKITRGEIIEIAQKLLMEAWAEFKD